MFALLDRAITIDIDTGNRYPDPRPPFASLFPFAQHIRLEGKMHYALVSAILHGPDKAPLYSLTLDNVLEEGLLRATTAFRFSHTISNGGGWAHNDPSDITEDGPEDSLPMQVAPGCMQRLLTLTPSLERRCQHIRLLYLRKRGQQNQRQSLSGAVTHHDDFYQEWAAFIRVVQPLIPVIAHARNIHPPWSRVKMRSCDALLVQLQSPEIAPMNEKFQTLLPLLREGWPGLERIETRGMSRSELGDLEDIEGVTVKVDELVKPCGITTVGND